MIFLDQEGVPKADAMIEATATGNGVFLGQTQTWQGFAGIQQANLGVGNPGSISGA